MAQRVSRGGVRGDPTRLADLISALTPAVRRELLVRVAQLPGCVEELAGRMELERTLVSKHLRLLRNVLLVAMEPIGHRHVYRTGPAASVMVMQGLAVVNVESEEGCAMTLRMTDAELRRLRLSRCEGAVEIDVPLEARGRGAGSQDDLRSARRRGGG